MGNQGKHPAQKRDFKNILTATIQAKWKICGCKIDRDYKRAIKSTYTALLQSWHDFEIDKNQPKTPSEARKMLAHRTEGNKMKDEQDEQHTLQVKLAQQGSAHSSANIKEMH